MNSAHSGLHQPAIEYDRCQETKHGHQSGCCMEYRRFNRRRGVLPPDT